MTKIFGEKQKASKVLFQKGVVYINNFLVFKHNDIDKAHTTTVSHREMESEEIIKMCLRVDQISMGWLHRSVIC